VTFSVTKAILKVFFPASRKSIKNNSWHK